ncbi:MAG: outer membrane beta-barrel protein [Flavobacteriales bacterium]|nr:outer membrane beta-barrel protein [Flavobacteriales bacterium]
MKKKFAILLLCGFLISNIQAQNFGGGLIAGVSTSQVAGDMLGGFNKIGLLTGAYTNLKVNENMSFQFEITYIEKGSKNPNIQKNAIQEISLSYVEVPISINLQQKENLGVEVGVLPAFIINSKMNDYYSETEISPPFEKYDFGVFAGINYHLTNNILLNTRISNSIIPIRPHTSGATFGLNKGQYNTVLSFAIHYKIR